MPDKTVRIFGFLDLGITKRTLKTIAIVVVVLLALLLCTRLVAVLILGGRFDARVSELRGRGEPVSPSELIPASVPDKQNAALLYELAFEKVDVTSKEVERLEKLADKRDPLTPQEMRELQTLLKNYEDPLRLMREGTKRRQCRFTFNYGRPWYKRDMSHLRHLSLFASWLRLASHTHLAGGKLDEAVQECVTIVRLAHSLGGEPDMVTMLVQMGIYGNGFKALENVMDRSDPSPTTLRQFVEAVGKVDDRSRFVFAMQAERAEWLPKIRRGFDVPREYLEGVTLGERGPPSSRRLSGFILRAWHLADGLEYLDLMGKYVALAGKPWHKARGEWEGQYERIQRMASPFRAPVTFYLVVGGYQQTAHNFERLIARKALAKLAVALRRYRMKHGRYPESLAALVPEFAKKLPVDPFNGTDFIYRIDGQGFILYSVDVDGKDNGGVDDWAKCDERDVVWRCSR